ncbi:MAG: hypothetical protein JRF54_16090, partial [Deltaproteobacteria bacterium]|nr:hypothetical protein [Deltaproteobacteria bacterium]
MITRWFVGCSLVLGLIAAGCGSDSGVTGGSGGSAGSGGTGGSGGAAFVPPEYGSWVKYEPEGATCSDGSPYAFYVEFSETSDNIVMYFMGGGGCWDYESCVSGGARGARGVFASDQREPGLPAAQRRPGSQSDGRLEQGLRAVLHRGCVRGFDYEQLRGSRRHRTRQGFRPRGPHERDMFGAAPEKKLFVGGCSAGGAGAIVNYYFLRTGIDGVERGYLLNDSGPLYPSQEPTSRSLFLHNEVRSVWDADSLIAKAPDSEALADDFGALSRVLSEQFPNDRLAATFFRLDYNFSLYSYERFWTLDPESMLVAHEGDGVGLDEDAWNDRTGIHTAWWNDIALLRAQYDAPGRDNLSYFIPFWRQTNSSHCVTIPGLEENPPLL